MKTFTIRDLERFSDIKAHTLRTWELRYNIPRPGRNEGNSRNYSLDDLKEILYMSILNKNGYKISCLSLLSPAETAAKLQSLTGEDNRKLIAIADMLVNMYTLDTPAFEAVLDDCFANMPLQQVLETVYTFLLKTNLFWQGHRLIEEHLVVTAIRKKIIVGIEKTVIPVNPAKTVLLFLDGTKQLDLGLLYTNYFLKNLGVQVIYLGNDVSVSNLEVILQKHQPDFLYTYVSGKTTDYFSGMISLLNEYLPKAKLIVSCQSRTIPSCSSDKIAFMDYERALQFLSA